MKDSVNYKLKCLIVDDEPIAREGLSKYARDIDFLELVGIASNPVELSSLLNKTSVDLIFLDIQMPLMSGIEFLKISPNLPMVVITTAHPSYAVEGFELDVIDYLLKPITFNRLFKAASKAKEYYHLVNKGSPHDHNEEIENNFFFVKCNNKYEKIFFEEILYVEAMQNYVNIYTSKSKFTTLLFLKNVESSLPKDQFIRIHRSYIIALNKVDQINNNEVLIREHRLPISRSLRSIVQEKIIGNHLLR